jgi:hypothetical protein
MTGFDNSEERAEGEYACGGGDGGTCQSENSEQGRGAGCACRGGARELAMAMGD